jgi:large subunit ribosomal protein L25
MKFVAFERAKQGTGASRRLRITGRTPGIVYGGSAEPLLVELDHNALWHALKMHPFKQLILHIDFQRVEANTKLSMKVPLHFNGEENSPAVKVDACLVNHVVTDLEVACLPADLPEFIAVDLSGLVKGKSLHAADLTMPKGVTVVTHGKANPVIVAVVAPVEEVAAPVAAAPAADAKGKGKGKK